jgi:hypothetical protein
MKRSAWMLAVFLAGLFASQRSNAQTLDKPTLYLLEKRSSFQRGCFPPCLCPIMIPEPLQGTFVLTPKEFDGLFDIYAVTEVNWVVPMNETTLIVTGSGTYKIGGEFALLQELSLDLEVGPGQVEHFDSGLVGVSVAFPLIEVRISLHGEVCFDTVFSVSGAPVSVPPTKAKAAELNRGE